MASRDTVEVVYSKLFTLSTITFSQNKWKSKDIYRLQLKPRRIQNRYKSSDTNSAWANLCAIIYPENDTG